MTELGSIVLVCDENFEPKSVAFTKNSNIFKNAPQVSFFKSFLSKEFIESKKVVGETLLLICVVCHYSITEPRREQKHNTE